MSSGPTWTEPADKEMLQVHQGRNLATFCVRQRRSYALLAAVLLCAYVIHPWALVLAVPLLFAPSDLLVVMRGTGVQLASTRYGVTSREFVPLTDIVDIVVNEGFHGYGQVVFYLCVLTRERPRVVFPHTRPRKAALLAVRRTSRRVLDLQPSRVT